MSDKALLVMDMPDSTDDGTHSDNQNAQDKLDITPQLAAAACNVIRDYCIQISGCKECGINDLCSRYFSRSPDKWVD